MPRGALDLVGLPWTEAERLLGAEGHCYETRLTAPPGVVEAVGELRVVGVRESGDRWVLILAHQDYRKPERDRPGPAAR